MQPPRALCALALSCVVILSAASADPVTLTRLDNRVRVEIAGQLFTEYVFTGATRPYLYPILNVDGTRMTRDFPAADTPGEDHDHPWHRSLWFGHSIVNGVDFWNEGSGDVGRSPQKKGNVVHDQLLDAKSGRVGVLRVTDRWVAPSGELICTDERTLHFQGNATARILDYAVTVHALPDKPLVFGDNKDGTMAMRLAQWMTMPHAYLKQPSGGDGHILDANGDRDAAAWGKRANWCDYYAAHNGKVYGVAIFDDPHNLRHPTWWMARDYGLFGANPFGQHDYEKLADAHIGDYTVPAGGSLTLKYRFVFHLGDPAQAHIAAQYARFSRAQ